MTSGHRGLSAAVATGVLGGLTVILVIAAVVLTVYSGNLSASDWGGTIALAVIFLAVGFLVAWRQQGNPIGWLLMCTGLSTAFTTAAALYTRLDYGPSGGSLPLGQITFFAENMFWPLAVMTGLAAVLLFPDGRLSRPWRRTLWAYDAVCVLVLVSQAIPVTVVVATGHLRAAVEDQLTAPPGG